MKYLNIIKSIFLATSLSVSLVCCTQESPITNPPVDHEPTTIERGTFAKGADVSWLTQMEAQGYTFYTPDRVETECMKLLRDVCGVNSIRLRVWVNPVEGWNDAADVVVKARRANSLGLRVMIDFHFSDTWADPGHQDTPAAWQSLDIEGLKSAVADHVTDVMSRLKAVGVEPEWAQIGNETRNGFMYPLGNLNDYPDNFASLVTTGHNAVKAVFPECKTIVHIDQGQNWYRYTHVFDTLKDAAYDMIGVSVYPEPDSWQSTIDDMLSCVAKAKSTYGKPVMVCEVGMSADAVEASTAMMAYLTEGCKKIADGVFYWEPQAPMGYNEGYNKGCFLNGAPTSALDCFK